MRQEENNVSKLLAFFITAQASAVERAKPLCHQWIISMRGATHTTPDRMLPTPLSPNGITPATHQLCAMAGSKDEYDNMQHFINEHQVPVLAVLGPQLPDASREAIDAARDAWLPTVGLKVIA
jgi:hypothetical protein